MDNLDDVLSQMLGELDDLTQVFLLPTYATLMFTSYMICGVKMIVMLIWTIVANTIFNRQSVLEK